MIQWFCSLHGRTMRHQGIRQCFGVKGRHLSILNLEIMRQDKNSHYKREHPTNLSELG